ncbi:MAG: hypothetical protein Q4C97_03965 [Bacillota bacterium]|nr:hypothetical protein [Bacillota bacterium]
MYKVILIGVDHFTGGTYRKSRTFKYKIEAAVYKKIMSLFYTVEVNTEMKNDIAKINDYCLEYELEILSAAEELTERRITATKNKSIAEIKNLVPLLNVIIDNVEIYKAYLEEDI